jgi:hypothetical protein
LPFGDVVKPTIDIEALLYIDVMVAEVSGVPSLFYLRLEFLDRDILGPVETEVAMRQYDIRAFMDGKARQALAFSCGGPAEK